MILTVDIGNTNISMGFVDEGKIIEDNTPEEVFNNTTHERTKEFLNKVLNR